jgi:hypothetical protein
MSEAECFAIVMKRIARRGVTYKELTGKLNEAEPC